MAMVAFQGKVPDGWEQVIPGYIRIKPKPEPVPPPKDGLQGDGIKLDLTTGRLVQPISSNLTILL